MTMTNNSIWMRLGVSVFGSAEDISNIIKGDEELLTKLLREGKFEIDGESYIPSSTIEAYNQENSTQHDDEGDVEFNLALNSFELRNGVVIGEEAVEHLEKDEVLVRICPETKSPVLIWHQGDGDSLCLHNETKEEDLRAVEYWMGTSGEVLNPDRPDMYAKWQRGEAELHIASLNIYSKKDNTLLAGSDDVFYTQTRALRYLVDYFLDEKMERLKDVYYVCETRLFSPPLSERLSYPTVESLFDLSDYREVNPYYSHTVNTPKN